MAVFFLTFSFFSVITLRPYLFVCFRSVVTNKSSLYTRTIAAKSNAHTARFAAVCDGNFQQDYVQYRGRLGHVEMSK